MKRIRLLIREVGRHGFTRRMATDVEGMFIPLDAGAVIEMEDGYCEQLVAGGAAQFVDDAVPLTEPTAGA